MKKILLVSFSLFIFALKAKAQKITDTSVYSNAFGSVGFLKGPVETLTIEAYYSGDFGKLSDGDISTLQSIKKIYPLNIKKFSYGASFRLDGCSKSFYVPCSDPGLFDLLSKQKNINKLQIKCTVYRFYTLDGITNFFYVDKGSIANL